MKLGLIAAAIAAMVLSLPASAAPTIENAVIGKTWSGSICRGNVKVSFTLTQQKGAHLIGRMQTRSSNGTFRFSIGPHGDVIATVRGARLHFTSKKWTSTLRLTGNRLVGTYVRRDRYYRPNRWCAKKQDVSYS